MSSLSAKKLNPVLDKCKSSYNDIFKFFTVPFAIKSLNKPSSDKKISISVSNLPFFTLLFNKLLKFEGFIIGDNSFI